MLILFIIDSLIACERNIINDDTNVTQDSPYLEGLAPPPNHRQRLTSSESEGVLFLRSIPRVQAAEKGGSEFWEGCFWCLVRTT